MKTRLICLLTAALMAAPGLLAQKSLEFEGKYAPEVVGSKLSYHFQEHIQKPASIRSTITYPTVCVWLGSLRFAKAAGDQTLANLLQDRFNLLLSKGAEFLPHMHHVDFNMFGSLPLELYQQTILNSIAACAMRIRNGQSPTMPLTRRRPGPPRAIPGRHGYGSTTCI